MKILLLCLTWDWLRFGRFLDFSALIHNNNSSFKFKINVFRLINFEKIPHIKIYLCKSFAVFEKIYCKAHLKLDYSIESQRDYWS